MLGVHQRQVVEDESEKKKQQVHNWVEQALVDKVCLWCYRVTFHVVGLAGVLLWLFDHEGWIYPSSVAILSAATAHVLDGPSHMTITLSWLGLIVVHVAIQYQGCTASLLPALFTFMPCAFGFIFRSKQAVVLSTTLVLLCTGIIFAVDLSGHCPSEPLPSDQKGIIFSERFLPLLNAIVGNCFVLIGIVGQSQRSLLLHAEAAQSAANLADVRRDVLHRMTHELRTPLNGIVGSVELLTSSETLNSVDMENALTIKSCLNTIVDICDSVLLAAKSSKGNERKKTVFRLASTVEAVSEIFTSTAASNGIDLKVEYLAKDVWVRGMEVELRQVLVNLVGNAVKFTDQGSVTIRVLQRTTDNCLSSTSFPDDDSSTFSCTFEVEDTGLGIDMKDKGMLFEAFHQGEQGAVSRRHKGTGLGLTICKDLVEQMGGNIEVEGERGRGTRFWFSLDLEQAQRPKEEESFVSPCRVVIADSEGGSSLSCQNMIKSVAPSAKISAVDSVDELLKIVAAESQKQSTIKTNNGHRVALVDCDGLAHESVGLTLSLIHESGWYALLYCEHNSFVQLITHARDAYAVFRRPLPLVRIYDTLRHVLASQALPTGCIGKQLMGMRQALLNGESVVVSRPNSPERASSCLSSTSHKIELNVTISSNQLDNRRSKVLQQKVPLSETIQPSGKPKLELGTGAKIVVVDDTEVNVKVLEKMLSKTTSATVVCCTNGQSAIDVVASSNPDDRLLFLMDWHMPLMDGLTATASIRQVARDKGFPECYVCMLTADIEGLKLELTKRGVKPEWSLVSKGRILVPTEADLEERKLDEFELSRGLNNFASAEGTCAEMNSDCAVDLLAEKPVTFTSVKATLQWFSNKKG